MVSAEYKVWRIEEAAKDATIPPGGSCTLDILLQVVRVYWPRIVNLPPCIWSHSSILQRFCNISVNGIYSGFTVLKFYFKSIDYLIIITENSANIINYINKKLVI